MIASTSSFELSRTDGTKLYIEVTPVTFEEDGKSSKNGVYQLQATRQNEPSGAYTEENPGDTTEIGSFAHRTDNKHEWVYVGEFLDDEEQEQIAAHIQALDDEDENDLESFYVQAFYHGGMNSFEITPLENSYKVAYDGDVIAELQHQEDWEQVSGEPLDEDVFVSIKQAIEAKFD
jgi:hypothetical protein